MVSPTSALPPSSPQRNEKPYEVSLTPPDTLSETLTPKLQGSRPNDPSAILSALTDTTFPAVKQPSAEDINRFLQDPENGSKGIASILANALPLLPRQE